MRRRAPQPQAVSSGGTRDLYAESMAERVLTPEGFAYRQAEVLDAAIRIFPARAFYPSGMGHPCDRFIVWNFTRWNDRARHSIELESIFSEGRLHQPDIYNRLEAMGFQITRENDRPVEYQVVEGSTVGRISGKPDGRVLGYRGVRFVPALVLEAKGLSDFQWDRTNTPEDLRDSPYPFTRGYYAQGQLYCIIDNLPRGLFVLKNKATGLLKIIPFTIDYGYAEALLKRIEALAPMVEDKIDPDPIPYDPTVCAGCGFSKVCYPGKSYGEGASVLDNPTLLNLLKRREQLHAGHREFEKIDATVKETLKHEGVSIAVCGDYWIEGKQQTDGTVRYYIEKK